MSSIDNIVLDGLKLLPTCEEKFLSVPVISQLSFNSSLPHSQTDGEIGLAGLKCPYCGFEGEFKQLKSWKYKWWDVYLYQCPKCGRQFRYQVDPEGKRKSYVLRVGVGVKRKGG